MDRYDWSRLNHLQVGRFAEYYVKMEFALYGFEIYSSEVDDRGIDFVVRRNGSNFYQVQVKSIRGLNYVFVPKAKFPIEAQNLVAVVVFLPGQEPLPYLIPMTAWNKPDALLASRDYAGELTSKPEWGLNLSAKNQPLLERFRFPTVIDTL